MRITRVYTRTGDKGNTRLVGGQEVPKDHQRIATYGTVDELNAIIGIIRVFLRENPMTESNRSLLDTQLHRIQNDLFNVGSDLATLPDDRWPGMYRVGGDDVTQMEGWIDMLNEEVGPLTEFILPGGGKVGAFFHQARTVCRRAERECVALLRAEPEAGEGAMRYLNRLSDYLFVAGRWAAKQAGEPEPLWQRPAPKV
jgi:cob(I)alamin adenosyltransferase